MITDKPFLKSFACGASLIAITIIVMLSAGQEVSAYRVGSVLGIFLIPIVATAFWASLSRKTWSWGRFIVTLIGFAILGVAIVKAGKNQKPQQPPASIVFSPSLPKSWVIKKQSPIEVKDGLPGHLVVLEDNDHTRFIIIQLSTLPSQELRRDFKYIANECSRGVLDAAKKNYGQVVEDSFSIKTIDSTQVADLKFHIPNEKVTLFAFAKIWIQEQHLVCFEAVGKGVPANDDNEIRSILSSFQISNQSNE